MGTDRRRRNTSTQKHRQHRQAVNAERRTTASPGDTQTRHPGGLTPVSFRGASLCVADPRFGLRFWDPARLKRCG